MRTNNQLEISVEERFARSLRGKVIVTGLITIPLRVEPTSNLRTDAASLRIEGDRRTRRPHRARWSVAAATVLLAALAGWWWLSGSGLPVVQTATATMTASGGGMGDQTVLNASGYVTARRRATVSARVTGRITEVLVEEGMPVRQGQVLARLDDSSARAAIDLAEAQLAAARSNLDEIVVRVREAQMNQARAGRLAAAGIAAAADLDTISAEVDALTARLGAATSAVSVAEKQVAQRRVELADTVVRAPFSGVAISKDAQAGEMVSPVSAGGGFTRTGISTIVDMSSLEIQVDVNEANINRVSRDQPVTAVVDAYPEWQIPARVITTVPAADRQKASVQVRIAFNQVDPRILPDMGVKVSFLHASTGSQSAPPARSRLLVPRRAVQIDDGRHVVFVVRDGRAERRPVTLGTGDADQIEIQSGLSAGERIVVDGPDDLTNNSRVQEAPVR
jgi:RND family efflux transporter MFP subunit